MGPTVAISAGCPLAAITEVKNFVAALRSRLFDTNAWVLCYDSLPRPTGYRLVSRPK